MRSFGRQMNQYKESVKINISWYQWDKLEHSRFYSGLISHKRLRVLSNVSEITVRDNWFLPLCGFCRDFGKTNHDAFYNPGYNFGWSSNKNRFGKQYNDYHNCYIPDNACGHFYMGRKPAEKALCHDINPMCPVNWVDFETRNSIFHLAVDFPQWEKSLAMAKSHRL